MNEPRELSRNEIFARGEPAMVHAIQSLGDVELEELSLSALLFPLFEYCLGEPRQDLPTEEEVEAAFELFRKFEISRHEGYNWFAGEVHGSNLYLYWLPQSRVAFVLHLIGGSIFNAKSWSNVASARAAKKLYNGFFPPEERPVVSEELLYNQTESEF